MLKNFLGGVRKSAPAVRPGTPSLEALEDRSVPASIVGGELPQAVQDQMVADLQQLAVPPKTPQVSPTDIVDPLQAAEFRNQSKLKNAPTFSPTSLVIVAESEPNDTPGTADPVDIGTGVGEDPDGRVSGAVTGAADNDFFSVDLVAGDELGIAVLGGGAFDPVVSLSDELGTLVYGNDDDNFTPFLPAENEMPRTVDGFDSFAFAVAPRTGRYTFGVTGFNGSIGAYNIDVRVRRPVLEAAAFGEQQRIFLDFDGGVVPAGTFGIPAPATLSPLSAFLAGWGLTPADENAVIDAIVAQVTSRFDATRAAGAAPGTNPGYDFRILNSRDDADTFGTDPLVSRVFVGGTIAELGIGTIGIADTIDLGNASIDDTAVVLLDLLSAGAADPNSLNSIARAPGATITDLIGVGVGNIVAHEVGHFIGLQHTDQTNFTNNLIDQGGSLANTIGLGPDNVFGNADDEQVLHVPDEFVANEGNTGAEENTARVSWGLSTQADGVAPTAVLGSAPTVTNASPATPYFFTVVYADNISLDAGTFGSGDVQVTGPNAFSQAATFVSATPAGDGTPRTVTYSIVPPGGTWTVPDNGTYTIAMLGNQVADASGNFVPPGVLGTFLVVRDAFDGGPTAALVSAPAVNVLSQKDTYLFNVLYQDLDDVALASLGNNDLQVIGPDGQVIAAELVATVPQADATAIGALYRIVPPGGTWTFADNGAYAIQLLANTVSDSLGQVALPAALGTFEVAIAIDDGFLQNLYRNVLNREIEVAALADYRARLDAGESRFKVAKEVWESAEHRGLQVDQFIAQLIDPRAPTPDPARRADWVQFLLDGGTEEQLIGRIAKSAEYRATHRFAPDFIDGLYEDLLGRPGDEPRRTQYLNRIDATFSQADAIGTEIASSPEYCDLVLGDLYNQFLLRGIDPTGQTGYRAVHAGGQGYAASAIDLLASLEYFVLHGSKNG